MRRPTNFRFDERDLEAWRAEAELRRVSLTEFLADCANEEIARAAKPTAKKKKRVAGRLVRRPRFRAGRYFVVPTRRVGSRS